MKRRRGSTTSTEAMEEEIQQKPRGSSILRKMIGAFRTSSNPPRLNTDIHKKQESDNTSHRRRSKSFDLFPMFSGSESFQSSLSPDFNSKRSQFLSRSLRFGTLNDLDDSFDLEVDERGASSMSRATAMTDISPQEESQPNWRSEQARSNDAHTSRITDSLITALRDPTKPILCFLSSNLPQERLDDRSPTRHSNRSSDSNINTRHTRTRASTFTVSLPMIKLEIPMENDEDIVNMSLSREDVEHFLPQPGSDPIPDLILSATGKTRSRTYSAQSLSRETQSSSYHPMTENPNSVLDNDTVEVGCNSTELNLTDMQASLTDDSIKSVIAKKRDSLKRSRQLHRTISDDGHERYRRRGVLERENELVESSLEDLHVASTAKDRTKVVDVNPEDEYASIASVTSERSVACEEDIESSSIEMQFLRTLKSGISRAVNSPFRTRKCDNNCTDDETWC